VTVVSNATPLIVLAAIGRFHLLRDLYTSITIPDEVFEEVVTRGAGRPGAVEVQTSAWVQRVTVANAVLVGDLMKELGAGEAFAIACAVELGAALLLMDEASGRARAIERGIAVRGSVGVIVEAKRGGLISAVGPVLDDLRGPGGLYVSDAVYAHALAGAGE
jgi:uncharacterized protein